jgi:hypothetical protein
MDIIEQIHILQYKQNRHDEHFHQDIFVLRIQQKLTHFCMHLAKYNGSMWSDRSAENTLKKLIDSLIIVTSCANTLRLNLHEVTLEVLALNRYCFWTDVMRMLSERAKPEDIIDPVGPMVGLVGRMSKALEALDHVEDYPCRKELEKVVGEMWLHLLSALHSRTTERAFTYCINDRLMKIEEKDIFVKYKYKNRYCSKI